MSNPLLYPTTVNAVSKQLNANYINGDAVITLNNTTSIQNNPGVCLINRIDVNGTLQSASEWTYIEFTATSGATLTGCTVISGGQDQALGKVVEFVSDVTQQQRILDALENLVLPATGAIDTTKVPVAPGTAGNVLTSDGTYWTSAAPTATGGASYWTDVPGTPTRVSDTQFTITDTSNANLYDLLFKKGVVLKWLESTTFQTAMVISSSYGTNTVTVNIVGDSLTAGFTAMKYCIAKAMKETFIVPGTLSAATDTAKTFYPSQDIYPLSCDARVKTAGTTNATEFDINDDGTSIFGGTAASIASTATTDIDNAAAAPTTAIVAGSAVTLDTNSVSTTAPIEAYVDLFYYPTDWRYR